MRARGLVPLLLGTLLLSGSLGAPFLRDEVPFDAIERAHFDAVGVARKPAAPDGGLLYVRVNLLGDAAGADLSVPRAWLLEHANVVLVHAADGAPLYLTHGDLAATSGRGTLGATVPVGMAVEVQDPDVTACVVAHEVLHFLGLRHVEDPNNIMYPHCSRTLLARAHLDDGQRAHVDGVGRVEATTPRGVEVWAIRG